MQFIFNNANVMCTLEYDCLLNKITIVSRYLPIFGEVADIFDFFNGISFVFFFRKMIREIGTSFPPSNSQ